MLLLKEQIIWKDTNTGIIKIRVTPKASTNKIRIEKLDDKNTLIRVYVTVVPESDKANKDVIKLLAKELNIPKSNLIIIHGTKNRNKTIQITMRIT